jgi:hypothetical protein
MASEGTKEVNILFLDVVCSALLSHARPGVHGQIRIEAPRVRRTLHHRPFAVQESQPTRIIAGDGRTRTSQVLDIVESLRSITSETNVGAVIAHFQDGRLLKYEVED